MNGGLKKLVKWKKKKIKIMNVAHIVGKKRNRLNRCNRRLASKDLVAVQRNKLVQRVAELEKELKSIK